MSKRRVAAFTASIDGYGAGPDQGVEHPLGVGGEALHEWMIPTKTFQGLNDRPGTTGADDDFARRSFENIGAWIMGRNMFGPVRGAWLDESWRGWCGETPPYHVPVFVRSEEHTSELQSLMRISYAVFCLTTKTKLNTY